MLLTFRDNHPKHLDIHEHNGAFVVTNINTRGVALQRGLAAWPCTQQQSPTKTISLYIGTSTRTSSRSSRSQELRISETLDYNLHSPYG
jgi:hypothetical protein